MSGIEAPEKQIQQFITKKFPAARKRAIDDATPLLEAGIVDSLGVLELVTFLESSFLIKIADEELTPENFSSIASMASFVEQKRTHSARPISSTTPVF
jgi:acyl carrier protein